MKISVDGLDAPINGKFLLNVMQGESSRSRLRRDAIRRISLAVTGQGNLLFFYDALARIIHERFYCNRQDAAATSLAAVSLRPGGQAHSS
ncbi:MAG: hypothetical protein JSS38_07705 [Nitrospira sp.]|nr:hypothetical protein [Nitrospira sp.]